MTATSNLRFLTRMANTSSRFLAGASRAAGLTQRVSNGLMFGRPIGGNGYPSRYNGLGTTLRAIFFDYAQVSWSGMAGTQRRRPLRPPTGRLRCIQIKVMALGAIKHRCLVNMMAACARNLAEMRCMRIGLVGSRFSCHLRIGAVAFDTNRRVGRLRRRTFRMAGGAIETCRDMLVDQKTMACTRCRCWGLRACLTQQKHPEPA
jgi:hypothetical protein